jgi:hypothetical protein
MELGMYARKLKIPIYVYTDGNRYLSQHDGMTPDEYLERNGITSENKYDELYWDDIRQNQPAEKTLMDLIVNFYSGGKISSQDYKKLQDKLNTRIQDYTFDEIIRSLENMFSKDFYKGKNDRNWTPNPTWILENNERLEQFLYMRPLKTKVQDTSQKFNELDNLDEFTPDPL